MTTKRPSASRGRALVSLLIIVLLLIGAVAIFVGLVETKPEPPRTERTNEGLLVETVQVARATQDVTLRAQGTVQAAREIVVVPEVTGRVRVMNPQLVPGGRIEEGDVIVRLDARDYRLMLESSAADVTRAELELQMEQGRRTVAQREWETFGDPDASERGRALATRDPQVRSAQIGVQAASSQEQRARLSLSRTVIRAPWNAMVVEERVDVGQVVSPQSQLATLVGTDEFWVQVSIPVEALTGIVVDPENGSRAAVHQTVGDRRVTHEGRVVRLLPNLDPTGAMARVIVSIPNPLDRAEEAGAPLLLGSFVDVDIDAPPIEDVIEVPRAAVQEGNRVYVMNDENLLEVREVDVVWGLEESVLVRRGLESGEHVIRSRIGTAVPGLLLRTVASGAASDQGTTTARAEPTPAEGERSP